MAEMVKANTRILDAKGMLPPKPEGFEDILNRMEVAIDPHQSIHAMAWMLQGRKESRSTSSKFLGIARSNRARSSTWVMAGLVASISHLVPIRCKVD